MRVIGAREPSIADHSAHGGENAWLESASRVLLFVLVFFYFWIGFTGFQISFEATQPSSSEGGNTINQIATVLLVVACVIFYLHHADRLPTTWISPLLILVLGWTAISVVLSIEPALAAKRFALAIFIVVLSAIFPLLARSRQQFDQLVQWCLLVLLAGNFLAIALVPSIALHQYSDLSEPDLAGQWRGLFPHKNVAGSAMALAVLFGIYIARSRNLIAGLLIVGGAITFLAFSKSKTPALILVPTVTVSWLIVRLEGTKSRVAVIAGLIGLANLFTLGSVVFPEVQSLVRAAIWDPTFTNRTDIWRFAFDQIPNRPIIGFGYHAFWESSWLQSSSYGIETWVHRAPSAHNGYIDLVINIGLPGFLFVLAWLFWQPMRDLTSAIARTGQSALLTLYVQIWAYCLFNACLESAFFVDGGPVWFSMLIAVFGLRYQVTANLIGSTERRQI